MTIIQQIYKSDIRIQIVSIGLLGLDEKEWQCLAERKCAFYWNYSRSPNFRYTWRSWTFLNEHPEIYQTGSCFLQNAISNQAITDLAFGRFNWKIWMLPWPELICCFGHELHSSGKLRLLQLENTIVTFQSKWRVPIGLVGEGWRVAGSNIGAGLQRDYCGQRHDWILLPGICIYREVSVVNLANKNILCIPLQFVN